MTKQNSGSAIVIVIVAMAFVGILASTLMWMSLMNFRMKVTERKVKESFYTAEMVFEQMVVGLQNLSSAAADQSYSFIMQNYANFPEQKRDAEFSKEYLKAVRMAISKSSVETNQYDLEKLMLYVDAGLDVGIVTPSASKSWIGAKSTDATKVGTDEEYKSRYGAIVAPVGADYILLKGLHLEYTDQAGFLTLIDTDLMISTPEAGFTQSGRMDNAFEYALIADYTNPEGVTKENRKPALQNEATSGRTEIDGNVYVGEGGILANNMMVCQNADFVISKGTVEVHKQGSFVVDKTGGKVPDFWTEGITIDKDVTSGSRVTLKAHSYVADDLTIQGNKATVTLTDSYYGYGNSDTKVEESSAIIINGINNSLDFSGVSQMLLAGHSYIGMKAKSLPTYGSPGERDVQIPMGESIAVKGGQIAYLVPDECVGVLFGQSVFAKNPLSNKDYEALNGYKNHEEYGPYYKEVDVTRQIASLGGKSLSSYGINDINGIEKVFVPSNGETLVYYYLNFPDTRSAERYFADYYGLHKEKLDRYVGLYASGGIKSNTGFTRLTMGANYFTATENGAEGNQVTLHAGTDTTALTDYDQELTSFRNIFKGLTTALTRNYLSLTVEEKTRGEVFDNIINKEQLKAYVGSGTRTFVVPDGSGYKGILTGEDTYTYDGDPQVVLIIATGDVVLSHSFEGVIFADGTVTMKAGASIKSAKNAGKMSELVRVLQSEASELDATRPLDFVRNADAYVLAGTALTKDQEGYHRNWVDFDDIVSYQNWTKH